MHVTIDVTGLHIHRPYSGFEMPPLTPELRARKCQGGDCVHENSMGTQLGELGCHIGSSSDRCACGTTCLDTFVGVCPCLRMHKWCLRCRCTNFSAVDIGSCQEVLQGLIPTSCKPFHRGRNPPGGHDDVQHRQETGHLQHHAGSNTAWKPLSLCMAHSQPIPPAQRTLIQAERSC